MLKADENIFLDDMTLEELEIKLGKKVIPLENDGAEFLNALINGDLN